MNYRDGSPVIAYGPAIGRLVVHVPSDTMGRMVGVDLRRDLAIIEVGATTYRLPIRDCREVTS